jgi:hypothetical protein
VILLCAFRSWSLDQFVNLSFMRAFAFDDSVMEDAIEDGGFQGAVIVEDLRPAFVGAIRRGVAPVADHLEAQLATCLSMGR